MGPGTPLVPMARDNRDQWSCLSSVDLIVGIMKLKLKPAYQLTELYALITKTEDDVAGPKVQITL